ncbi:MAG: hypothetical protein FJX76_08420 [Armatimonadetes bacterium]|nr:hypothetical protein [Armatimonadota bacterium]
MSKDKVEGIEATDVSKMTESSLKQADKAGNAFSGKDGGGGAAECGAAVKIEPSKDVMSISDEAKGK